MARISYEDRLQRCQNPLLRKLYNIIIEKKSNLCIAANFTTIEETLEFVDKVGKHICILKTQCERLDGDPADNLRLLCAKKKEYNFLLFEDRKFCDGHETILSQYKKYVKYADLVTVVPIYGDGVFKAIEDAARDVDEPRGCLAVCEVSFSGCIPIDPTKLLESAERNFNICVGIIAQKLQVSDQCAMIKATPGVHMDKASDGHNQQWNHPSIVVRNGADIVIVGRGIVSAAESDRESITRRYKEVAYQAYCDDVNAVTK